MEINWRDCDRTYYQLKDVTLFWTFIHLAGDALYSCFILGSVFDTDIDPMVTEGIQNHVNPVLLYLIVSILANLGVLVNFRQRHESILFYFSLIKLLLFPITLITHLYLLTHGRFFFGDGDMWFHVVCLLAVYNMFSICCLYAHFSFHKHIFFMEKAERRLVGRRLGVNLEKAGKQLDLDLENPLEKFYVQKTAQLHHNYLMKEMMANPTATPTCPNVEGLAAEDEMHLYCKEFGSNVPDASELDFDTDSDTEGEEDESGCGCKDPSHQEGHDDTPQNPGSTASTVFTVSEGVEQFISRSISLDMDEYHISNVVISL